MLAGLGAAVVLACYYVLGARGVQQRDTLSLTTWAFGASAVAGLLTRAVTAGSGGWEPLGERSGGVPVLLLCAYVVVLGSIVPFLLISGALRHLPATSVSILGMAEPVIASVVAWLTLGAGEALTPVQIAGGLIVLAGVALAESARLPAPPPRPPRLVPVDHEVSLGLRPPRLPAGRTAGGWQLECGARWAR